MNTLSLFGGIECGKEACNRVGFKIDKYYYSEIDKNAIKIAKKNHPSIIELGDITKWKEWNIDWSSIDLLLGGSPCQGFSFAGKQLNFEDPRSKLFFIYAEILNHIKALNPNIIFLLENVKMKKEYQNIISHYLGIEPIEINSSLLSAQNRVRLYWTNIPGVQQPQDRGITLDDILEEKEWDEPATIRGRRINKGTIIGRRLNKQGHREDYNKEIPITQCLEVRATNRNKSNCLTTVGKDNVLTPMPIGRHPDAFKNKLPFRYYTVKEYCRLQTLPDNYMDGVSDSQAKKLIGNGWTVDVIAWILSFLKGAI